MRLLFLFCLYFSLMTPVQAHEALDRFLNGLQTLHGQFEQKQYGETGELLEISQGEVFIQRPGKFRWDYQKPYQQLIVANGKKVWVYDQDLRQVTVKTLNKALGKTPALLLSSENTVEQDFTVTPVPSNDGSIRLELKPKDPQAQFEVMYLNLKDNILLGLELKDNLEQTTVIAFSQLKSNQTLTEDLFGFIPPPDVDVVEDKD